MIEGLHYVAKRKPGNPVRWYVYAYRGGPCIAKRVGGPKPGLTKEESAKAVAAIEALTRPDPNTLRSLIRSWQASKEWERLSAGTRKTWGSPLRMIEDKWGDTPLSLWQDPRMAKTVMDWRDSRAAKPRAADIGVMVLRSLFKYGRLSGQAFSTAAEGIPTLYRGGNRQEIVWTDEDIDRFSWHAVKLDRAHIIDGLWLAALTGMRRDDLVSVRDGHVYEYAIVKKALKVSRGKRRTATMPRIPELDALLDELRTRHRAEGVDNVLVNSFGKPWTGDGFGTSFNRIRDAAEIVHIDEDTGKPRKKHLHDARGTFCTRLILSGLSDKECADIMGWSPDQVADIRRVYVDQARVVVAIGERIAAGGVNRAVNQPGGVNEN